MVKNLPANARGHGFDSWSEKIPHAAGQLSPCETLLSLHSTSQVRLPPLMVLTHELEVGPAVFLMLRAQCHQQGSQCLQCVLPWKLNSAPGLSWPCSSTVFSAPGRTPIAAPHLPQPPSPPWHLPQAAGTTTLSTPCLHPTGAHCIHRLHPA